MQAHARRKRGRVAELILKAETPDDCETLAGLALEFAAYRSTGRGVRGIVPGLIIRGAEVPTHRARILRYLRTKFMSEPGRTFTAAELATALGFPNTHPVRARLSELLAASAVETPANGLYRAAPDDVLLAAVERAGKVGAR